MIIIDNILYLTFNDLIEYGYTGDYLKKATMLYRKNNSPNYRNIPDPADARKILIDFDSIPQKALESRDIPPKAELVRQVYRDQLQSLVKIDNKAHDFYYATPDSHRARSLQLISSYLMLCAPINRSMAREMGYNRVDDFYTDVMELLLDLNNDPDHWMDGWKSTNLRHFKRKLKPFYEYYCEYPTHFMESHEDYYYIQDALIDPYRTALESLVSKRYGKVNRAKINSDDSEQVEQQQALLIRLHADPIKLSYAQTHAAYINTAQEQYRLYQESDGEQGWNANCLFTLQTAKNFLNRPDIRQIWYEKRHGKKAYDDKFTPITLRKAPSRANAKWVIDGTPVHMYFSHGKNHYQRLNVFVVIDEYSWAIIGYAYNFTEDSDLVVRALRNACENTGTLPYEIQSDNSSAIQSYHAQQAINTIAKVYRPAQAGNARSKVVEPFFRQFNARILKFKPGFMGNPHGTLDYQPNMEAIAIQAKSGLLPNLQEAQTYLEQSFNEWNTHVFKGDQSPQERYIKSVVEHQAEQRKYTDSIDIEAFWYVPGKMVQVPDTSTAKRRMKSVFKPTEYTYDNRGLIVNIGGEKYTYSIPDADWNRGNMYKKYTIKIEPTHRQEIILMQDGKPLTRDGKVMIISQTYQQPSAALDMKDDDGYRLAATLQAKKQQRELTQKEFDRYEAIAKSNGYDRQITASWVHGKELANTSKAELNEELLNKRLSIDTTEDEPDVEPEYIDDEPPINHRIKPRF